MIKLIINKDEPNDLSESNFGGKPVTNRNKEFDWPFCYSCNLPMQYQFRISTKLGLEQVFMCQNEPGCCDEWNADGGGNKVIVVEPNDLKCVEPPENGDTLRATDHGSLIVEYEAEDYDEARSAWAAENEVSPRKVLGRLSGEPSWLQDEEVPKCSKCNNEMNFAAQLEQGPNWETEMNFGGGGCAYLFDCNCDGSAKFLWQC